MIFCSFVQKFVHVFFLGSLSLACPAGTIFWLKSSVLASRYHPFLRLGLPGFRNDVNAMTGPICRLCDVIPEFLLSWIRALQRFRGHVLQI